MIKCLTSDHLEEAARLLLEGGVVAFPTETVYGLGACLFLEEAIEKIFIAKGRPKDNPLIVHVADLASVESMAENIPPLFYQLAEAFFPGPLTLIIPKSDKVPLSVSAGLASVAVRMPRHPMARKLIQTVGQPLVAPSANRSGKPSATHFMHVLEDFQDVISAVIQGESSEIGIESTVVNLLDGKVEIVRPGVIRKEQIEEVIQRPVSVFSMKEAQGICPSPGVRYRHYAPKAPVFLCSSLEQIFERLQGSFKKKRMLLSSQRQEIPGMDAFFLSSHALYEMLRLSDRAGYEEVFVLIDEVTSQDPALMNRLEKASEEITASIP